MEAAGGEAAAAAAAADGDAPVHPLPKATAVAVEYPGFVRDTERCLETLGAGRGDLQRVRAAAPPALPAPAHADTRGGAPAGPADQGADPRAAHAPQ